MSAELGLIAGTLIASVTVLISTLALVHTWRRGQNQRAREEAERTRRAVGLLIGKVDRWMHHSLSLADEVQPLFVDVDAKLVRGGDREAARELLWREIGHRRRDVLRRIHAEGMEVAYADLAGYDERIRDLFTELSRRMRTIDDLLFERLLASSQQTIGGFEGEPKSAEVGNLLRRGCATVTDAHRDAFQQVISPFQRAMRTLLQASDRAITRRAVALPAPDVLYPSGPGTAPEAAPAAASLPSDAAKPLEPTPQSPGERDLRAGPTEAPAATRERPADPPIPADLHGEGSVRS